MRDPCNRSQPATRLETGDRIPDFSLPVAEGRSLSLAGLALGKPILIFFCRDLQGDRLRRLIMELLVFWKRLIPLAHIIFICSQPLSVTEAIAKKTKPPFPLLSDPQACCFAAYGLSSETEDKVSCVIADSNRHLLRIDHDVVPEGFFPSVIEVFASLPNPEPLELGPVAPVLYVPRAFDQAFCRELIETWHTAGHSSGTVLQPGENGEGKEVVDNLLKSRVDHLITDRRLDIRIFRDVQARIAPEIQKAFQFSIARSSGFKIGRYSADEGGVFVAHRDDTAPQSRHRRFALTVNLNTGEYEGGHLRFPEYGPHLYKPLTGDALVFSCSLVHEVLPVSAGKRFALIGFFYGQDSINLPPEQLV